MKQLEMAIAFSGLESIKYEHRTVHNGKLSFGDGANWVDYNPITDLALNCAARDKYEVEVEYWLDRVVIDGVVIDGDTVVYFEDKSEIPRAIIECILKSKGLWK